MVKQDSCGKKKKHVGNRNPAFTPGSMMSQ